MDSDCFVCLFVCLIVFFVLLIKPAAQHSAGPSTGGGNCEQEPTPSNAINQATGQVSERSCGGDARTDSPQPNHADGRPTRVVITVGCSGSGLTDVLVMRTKRVIPRSTILARLTFPFLPAPSLYLS